MADPLSPIDAFIAQGMAWAQGEMARTISIKGTTYIGVRSDLDIDPRELKPGGFQKSKRFSICMTKSQFEEVPKDGVEVTDDLGQKFKIRSLKMDAVQITLTCDNISI